MAEILQFPSKTDTKAKIARARLDELMSCIHTFSMEQGAAWTNLALAFTDYQQAFMAYAYTVGEDNVEEEYWELFLGGDYESQDIFQWDFEDVYDW